jgi:phosphoglycolate phosphatase
LKLLIFDVDGTLTHIDGATRRAFRAAFQRLYGLELVTDTLKLHGRTDPLIFRDCYEFCGLHGDWQAAFDSFRKVYLEELPVCIAAGKNVHLHPGVSELLEALASRPGDVALVLGTGNMEAGARTKIGHFGLNRYFPVGGFGDAHDDRTSLLRDAVRNAENHWKRRFAPADTWVIGDTVYDIEGGKALSLRTMGVTTGGAFSFNELAAAGADAVFENLSDTARVLNAFGLA